MRRSCVRNTQHIHRLRLLVRSRTEAQRERDRNRTAAAATERGGAGWGCARVYTVHPITMATTVASFVARPMAARPVARKAMAGAPLRATASNGSSTVMRASWLPGSTPPAHLKGTLPGDFGAGLLSCPLGTLCGVWAPRDSVAAADGGWGRIGNGGLRTLAPRGPAPPGWPAPRR